MAIDPKQLRVSDDERAHVLALLARAARRGLLDRAEYGRRSEAASAALTRADLNTLLLDLPGLRVAGRTVEDAAMLTAGPLRHTPGYSGAPAAARGAEVLELTGWGSRSFRGRWPVPPHIVIGGVGAGTRLDFSRATLTSTTVTVEFRSNIGGSAEFVLPRGGTARLDGLSVRGGSVDNRIPPGPGGLLDLSLTGTKRGGSISIRHPR